MKQVHLDNLPEKELLPGLHVKFVHSEKMTFAYWNIDAGADLPSHRHPHEQVVNMLSGQFELTVDGVRKTLRPGEMVIIPPDTEHSGKAVSACRVLDVFCPVREDYRE